MTNKEFERLSTKQKRIAIARDVIDALAAKKFKAEHGTYCQLTFKEDPKQKWKYLDEDTELRQVLKTKVEQCTVCAAGALFTAHVAIANKFKISDTNSGMREYVSIVGMGTITDRLSDIFEPHQLIEIELAFEKYDVTGGYAFLLAELKTDSAVSQAWLSEQHEERKKKLIAFGTRFKTPHTRMKAIMQNIIDNGGKFVV